MENIIADLLLRHNCVIIPSFGGFVAKPVSAQIDFQKGTILPPSKSILFNKQLINNDGLLINEFAHRKSYSYDIAEKEISNLVSDWNEILRSGRRIEIDRVGILYLDEEKKVIFEQDRFFNLLMESFGLGTVNFIPQETVVEKEKEVIRVEETKESAKIIQLNDLYVDVNEQTETVAQISEVPAISRKRRSAWKYVAAACMLPVMFYAVWIPVKTDVLESGVLSIKDFNPFYHSSKGTYKSNSLESAAVVEEEKLSLSEEVQDLESDYYQYSIDGSNFIAVNLGNEVSNDTDNTGTSSEQSFAPNSMNYIVGCFSNESNAINLVQKLKSEGFDARIYDFHNGLHRVTAGSAISAESLEEIKGRSEASGYKGWILK